MLLRRIQFGPQGIGTGAIVIPEIENAGLQVQKVGDVPEIDLACVSSLPP
jgi:hypothetical protein